MAHRHIVASQPTTACSSSCQSPRPLKHLEYSNQNPLKRKSVTVSQAIALAAAAASVAVIITALAATYFLSGPWLSPVVFSTTSSNSFVSTTTRSTAYAREHMMDTLLQNSLRVRNMKPYVSTEANFPGSHIKDNNADGALLVHVQSGDLIQSQPAVAGTVDNDGVRPMVAWLMSFPNSGTSYTLHLTREATNTTTATNYALEGDFRDRPSVPIHDQAATAGPFLELTRDRITTIPNRFILTKTHCGGYCSTCHDPRNYIETPRSFQMSCQTGTKSVMEPNGTLKVSVVTYDASLVKKAVHVIRNPLDNVVARFHLDWRNFQKRDPDLIVKFPSDKAGFNKWCTDMDRVKKSTIYPEFTNLRWVDRKLVNLLEGVPCKAEFYRYVQWHNLAFSVSRDMGIPTLIVHYQDYRDDWDNTVSRLLNFLELDRNGAGEPFDHGKEYRDYYTLEQRAAIKAFIQGYSTKVTWENVKDYEY